MKQSADALGTGTLVCTSFHVHSSAGWQRAEATLSERLCRGGVGYQGKPLKLLWLLC